ncbi:MAG TPA: hypothetical protein VL334_19430 [Anaerolineae bacterium]|nr:hypothetical protein [Anaerolineae bacterium]
MIRAFGLRDVLAVRSLQHDGVWLDLFHYLLLRRSALATALIAPVPWVGAGLASYVWSPMQQTQGFVQMLKRPGRHEADLLFLTPRLEQAPYGQAAWENLLSACIAEAGAQALRRLFVSVPEGKAEIDVLASLGFMIYTSEEVFVLFSPPRLASMPSDLRLRPGRSEDVWWLRRLYSIYTPQPVQHAEGHTNDSSQASLPLAWWELTNQSSFVVDDKGEVLGGVQLVSGRRGHWLLLHGDPGDAELMTTVLRYGIEASGGSRWPIYCAVRSYQGGLAAVMQDHGFHSFARRSRLIKHLAVRVKAAEPVTAPNLVIEGPGP